MKEEEMHERKGVVGGDERLQLSRFWDNRPLGTRMGTNRSLNS